MHGAKSRPLQVRELGKEPHMLHRCSWLAQPGRPSLREHKSAARESSYSATFAASRSPPGEHQANQMCGD